MRVGIIQPFLFPWRGYFDFINSVDVFIFLDDVNLGGSTWVYRNYFKSANGLKYFNASIKSRSRNTKISELILSNYDQFKHDFINGFDLNYKAATNYHSIKNFLTNTLDNSFENLCDLNIYTVKKICDALEIKTKFFRSSDFNNSSSKSLRLAALIKQVGGTCYLTGPAALNYLDNNLFYKEGISIEVKTYNYKQYNQLWGNFEPNVSIIDLLAIYGWNVFDFIKSQDPDKKLSTHHKSDG